MSSPSKRDHNDPTTSIPQPQVVTNSDGSRTLVIPSTPLHAAGSDANPMGEDTLPYPETIVEEPSERPPLDSHEPFNILEAQPRHMFTPGSELEERRRLLVTEACRRWNPSSLNSLGVTPLKSFLSADESKWYDSILKILNSSLRPLIRRSEHSSASVNGVDVFVRIQAVDFQILDASCLSTLESVDSGYQEQILQITPLPKFALAQRRGNVPFADFAMAAAMYREDVECFLKTHLFAIQSIESRDRVKRQKRRTSTGTSSMVDQSGLSHVTRTVASSSGISPMAGPSTTANRPSAAADQLDSTNHPETFGSYRTSAVVRGFKEAPPHLSRVERLRLKGEPALSAKSADVSRDVTSGRRMSDIFGAPSYRYNSDDVTVNSPNASSTLADAGTSFKHLRAAREFPPTSRQTPTAQEFPSHTRDYPTIFEENPSEAIAEIDRDQLPIQLPSSTRQPPRKFSGTKAIPASTSSPKWPSRVLKSGLNSPTGASLPPASAHQVYLGASYPPTSAGRHPSTNQHSLISEEEEGMLPIHPIRGQFHNQHPASSGRRSLLSNQPTLVSNQSRRSHQTRQPSDVSDGDTGGGGGERPPRRIGGRRPLDRFGGGQPPRPGGGVGRNPGDPGGDSSDSDNGRHPGNRRFNRPAGYGRQRQDEMTDYSSNHRHSDAGRRREMQIPQFDNKLKPNIVDEWDGDPDTLVKWIESVNIIGNRGHLVFRQLGEIVPTRLTKRARTWFYGLTNVRRHEVMADWGTMREAIRIHFMNRAWMDRQKRRALEARYRDKANPKESPTDYLYRKVELLDTVVDFTDSELIMEVMENAPAFWAQIIDTQRMRNLEDLQDAVKYHEERLEGGGVSDSRMDDIERQLRTLLNAQTYQKSSSKCFFKSDSSARAQISLVGFHASIKAPPYPKDDKTVSPNGRTPESKGARPCRHCGSGNHWDPECKYAKKGNKIACSHHISQSSEYLKAQEAYDELYYATTSADEESGNSGEESFNGEESTGSDVEDFILPQV